MIRILIICFSLFSFNYLLADEANFKNSKIDYQKSKITYVDFWASWCGPCLESFPWMNQIIDKYEKKGLNIVAVSIDGRKEAALKFLEENPANFEILFDTDSQMLVQFGVRVVPSSFILDDKGNLLYSHLGFSSKDKPELEKVIKKFLEIK